MVDTFRTSTCEDIIQQVDDGTNITFKGNPAGFTAATSIDALDFFLAMTAAGAFKKITRTNLITLLGAVTTETDPVFLAHVAYGITATLISHWNSAYGWGDHSVAGYLTALLHDLTARHTLGTVVPHDALGSLSTVTLGTLANKDLLTYDTSSGKWINRTAAAADLATATHTQGADKGGTGIDLTGLTGYLYVTNSVVSVVTTPSLPSGTSMLVPFTLHGDIVTTTSDNVGFMEARVAIPTGFTKLTAIQVSGCAGWSGSAGSTILALNKVGYAGGGAPILLTLAGTAYQGTATGSIAVTGGSDTAYVYVSSGNSYHTTLSGVMKFEV